MRAVLDVVSVVSIVVGATLVLLGAIGVLRFRDPLVAMHAATKPATLGVVLTGLGTALQFTGASSITKVVLVVLVQLATFPVGSHMLGRAMSRSRDDD